jgi:hypothetical protein
MKKAPSPEDMMQEEKKNVPLNASRTHDNFNQPNYHRHLDKYNFKNERGGFQGRSQKYMQKEDWDRATPPANNEKKFPNSYKQNHFSGNKKPYSVGTYRKGDREMSKSQQISNFCQNLDADSPFPLTKENLQLWVSSFEMTLTSPRNHQFIYPLLGAYLHFPDQSGYAPNPLTVVKILCLLLSESVDLCDVELAHDIIKDRLLRSSSINKLTDKDSLLTSFQQLQSIFEDTTRRLFQSPDSDFNTLIKLSSNFRKSSNNYESTVQNLNDDEAHENSEFSDPILQWTTSPTLKWLLNGSLYQAVELKHRYSDAEDYVTTIRKVWTMLTFYWGTAAFWPKCTCQSHSKPCGTPLLTCICTRGTFFCTKRGHNQEICGKPATWRCMRRGHDAICQHCLSIRQKNLMGPSGVNASTDIYDGTISSSQIQGDSLVLDIFDTLSRKPPKEHVNWRTSYRLQPNMLVGIICLSIRNMELNPSMKIHWGEIVIKDKEKGIFEEFSRRESNMISIRLLSRSDFPEMTPIHETFLNNSHLVIIDLRVFVPEVMTVLCTLAQKSFLDGFQKVSFTKFLLNPDCPDEKSLEMMTLPSSSLQAQLEIALGATSIDCLSTISQDKKTKIIEKICRLKMIQTLDKTQRESFVYALMKPLHCIQGPPGTGKVCNLSLCLSLTLSLSVSLYLSLHFDDIHDRAMSVFLLLLLSWSFVTSCSSLDLMLAQS